jgi:hypothetical protein
MGLEVLEAMKSNEHNYEEPVHAKVAGEELSPHTVK